MHEHWKKSVCLKLVVGSFKASLRLWSLIRYYWFWEHPKRIVSPKNKSQFKISIGIWWLSHHLGYYTTISWRNTTFFPPFSLMSSLYLVFHGLILQLVSSEENTGQGLKPSWWKNYSITWGQGWNADKNRNFLFC